MDKQGVMFKKNLLLLLLAVSGVAKAQTHEIKPVDKELIFSCFKQGDHGDCVSIGVIKAAISVFGLYGVFKERPVNDTLTEVTLKNGATYNISQREFNIADTIMHIRKGDAGIPEVMQYAKRCFAVMAKVKQTLENIPTYDASIYRLVRISSGKKSFYKLGLENNIVMLGYHPDFSDKCNVVGWRKKHVAYICNGYMDNYGKKVPVTDDFYGGFMVVNK
ncbi:hypothetical protein [Parasediminibacterium sp. JCM 36343]|uniref:hypothetical protein n=1 Tax=Parasediminibacterium sp. JCM 36343 TaxID=3374279 RepID=UPI00397D1587